jgi:hypothetical protein
MSGWRHRRLLTQGARDGCEGAGLAGTVVISGVRLIVALAPALRIIERPPTYDRVIARWRRTTGTPSVPHEPLTRQAWRISDPARAVDEHAEPTVAALRCICRSTAIYLSP